MWGGRGMWVHSASHRAGGTREQHLVPGLPLSVGRGWVRTTAGRGSHLSPQNRRWLSDCHLDRVLANEIPVGSCVCFSDKRGWTHLCHRCSVFPP